jgi:hypothetical protein
MLGLGTFPRYPCRLGMHVNGPEDLGWLVHALGLELELPAVSCPSGCWVTIFLIEIPIRLYFTSVVVFSTSMLMSWAFRAFFRAILETLPGLV